MEKIRLKKITCGKHGLNSTGVASPKVEENLRLVRDSDDMLAPFFNGEAMRVLTGAGSHTTAMLRLVDWCGEHDVKLPAGIELENLGVGGLLSKQRILELCPSMSPALDSGLKFTVVRHQIADRCPGLMALLSEADNAKHDTFRKESSIETLFNIHRRAMQMKAKTEKDFLKVADVVSRGHNSTFKKDVQLYSEFVRAYSGGETKIFLVEIDKFCKTLKTSREVAPDFFRDVGRVNMVRVRMPRTLAQPRNPRKCNIPAAPQIQKADPHFQKPIQNRPEIRRAGPRLIAGCISWYFQANGKTFFSVTVVVVL